MLTLEGITSFLSENLESSAYCVSYKHHTLLDDLFQYLDTNKNKDYTLLVDDANKIDAFNQITSFYRANRKGKLKVIITVRDHAFQEIGMLCQDFTPKRIDLNKFSDKQVIEIIKQKPFEILNPDYHKEMVRIADGIPRLAIMTSLLAKADEHVKIPEQNLSTYFFYKSFVKDGLLSFKTILSNYYESNKNRFKDCVIPANNYFRS